jgi:hypothetical protein
VLAYIISASYDIYTQAKAQFVNPPYTYYSSSSKSAISYVRNKEKGGDGNPPILVFLLQRLY